MYYLIPLLVIKHQSSFFYHLNDAQYDNKNYTYDQRENGLVMVPAQQ